MKLKSVGLAIFLNLIYSGLGYMYMGRWIVGIFIALVYAMLLFGLSQAGILAILAAPSFLTMYFIFNLIMIIDMLILNSGRQNKMIAANTTKCPFCAERIQKAAIMCPHCRMDVKPRKPPTLTL